MGESTQRILLTGGSGRLGTELRPLLGEVWAPPHGELDVTSPDQLARAVASYRPTIVVHAAAFTDVAAAESRRAECWAVNVAGTRNVVAALAEAGGAMLVHISTDYVFDGARGMYREDDPPGPVRNYYALSKLAAEEVARTARRRLVIRTSFRPRQWPYPAAFTDLFTSQDYVDVIAPLIAQAVRRCGQIPFDTLHVATERKSAFELARRRRADVQPALRRSAPVELPADISLDVSRWRSLAAQWDRAESPGREGRHG